VISAKKRQFFNEAFATASSNAARASSLRTTKTTRSSRQSGWAALAVVDGLVWQLWWAWGGSGVPEWFLLRPFQALTNVAVALVIAGVFPRDHRTRAWAFVLLTPSAIIISRTLHDVMGLLIQLIRLF
jgi:uncharacterized membrane protein